VAEPYRAITPDTPLPSLEEVYELWDRYQMLPNIRRHSMVVRAVALAVCDWLAEAGVEMNRRAVEVGALLHDIAKTPCLGTDLRHDVEGQKILESLGYHELGYLVRKHVYLPPAHPLDETMVVNYADKRVNHDRVVSLDERFRYILERYAGDDPRRRELILQGKRRAEEIQQVLFSHMLPHRHPQDLNHLQEDSQ